MYNIWNGLVDAADNVANSFGFGGANNNNVIDNANSQEGGFDYNAITKTGEVNENFGGGVENKNTTTNEGWNWNGISKGTNALSGIANSYINYKNYKNAEDTLDFQKDAWQANYDQSLAAYNRQVERQGTKDDALANTTTLRDKVNA